MQPPGPGQEPEPPLQGGGNRGGGSVGSWRRIDVGTALALLHQLALLLLVFFFRISSGLCVASALVFLLEPRVFNSKSVAV